MTPAATPSADAPRPSLPIGTALVLLLAVGLYHFAVVYALVFTDGLCCADDSAMAIVAKNLALEHGYATSLQHTGTPGVHSFDYGVSTGPAVIVPAAILIRIFGNAPWVPGFVTATLSLLLLVLIFASATAIRGWPTACLFVSVFLLLAHCLTVRHFEHWYALLGEVPAALLAIAALCCYGSNPRSTSRLIRTGLLGGTAVLAKLLAILSVLPVIAALLFGLVRDHGAARRGRARDLAIAMSAFMAPLVAFETWRFASLGPKGYLGSVRQLLSFGHERGLGAGVALGGRVAKHFSQFAEHFGFSPLTVVAMSLLSVALLAASPARPALRTALALHSASLTYLGWWLAWSTGWNRYALIGLLLYAAGLALSVYGSQDRFAKLAILGAIVAVHVPPVSQLLYPIERARNPAVMRLAHLRETVEFLNARRESSLLVYGSWATVAELEFALPGVDNFRRVDNIGPGDVKDELLLVRNTIWRDFMRWSPVDEWEQGCAETLLDRPPFLVSRCPFERQKYDRLSRMLAHVLRHQAPEPAVRIRAAGLVDLFAHAPTALALDVPAGGGQRLILGYGIDNEAWGKGGSDGVCFVVSGVSPEGERAKLLNDCLDPQRIPASPGLRTATLRLAPGTTQVILETDPRGGREWDWSYWRDVELRPGD